MDPQVLDRAAGGAMVRRGKIGLRIKELGREGRRWSDADAS